MKLCFIDASLSNGIDLFIYIVGSLILLMSETGVFKFALQLNNAVSSALADGALNPSSEGKLPDSLISHTNGGGTGIPQGNLKIIDEYPIIALFSVFGINCLISSNDIISIFLSIELQSLAFYILASLCRESESAFARLKYFLLGSLSSAILLLGVVLIYSFTGLTEFEGLSMLCSTSISNSYIFFSALLVLVVGLLFKVATSPFHNRPNVYNGTPTIVTAWLITMSPIVSLLSYLTPRKLFCFLNYFIHSSYCMVRFGFLLVLTVFFIPFIL
jgi:NADH-ubiquinone oxidoreductase chain 2